MATIYHLRRGFIVTESAIGKLGQSRNFSRCGIPCSGHSKWSKIKHDKGVADSRKGAQRTAIARDISTAVKNGGPDPNFNPRLASVLSSAKKAGMPKVSLDAAIARGQGLSLSGAALEQLTLEVMLPPSCATIIDLTTDNKARTMQDVKAMIKDHGGTFSPTSYLFQRRGRIVFECADNFDAEKVLDDAIDAGAEDLDKDGEGNLVIWTEPSQTISAADKLAEVLGLQVASADVTWTANEDTQVALADTPSTRALTKLFEDLRERSDVVGIYSNVKPGPNLDEAAWGDLMSKLD